MNGERHDETPPSAPAGPSSLPAGDLGSLGRAGPSSSPVEGSRGVVLTGRVVAVSPRSGVSRSTDGVPWSVSYPARAPDDAGSDGTRGDLVQVTGLGGGGGGGGGVVEQGCRLVQGCRTGPAVQGCKAQRWTAQ